MTSLKEQPSGAGYVPKTLLLSWVANTYFSTEFLNLIFPVPLKTFLLSLFVFAAASIFCIFTLSYNTYIISLKQIDRLQLLFSSFQYLV